MTWGAIGSAAVGVVGTALTSSGGSSSGGGAGTQTASKEPWLAAQPWIMNNMVQGQNLQNAYTSQPFSALQNQAYTNQNNQSAYMRAAVPSLLGQISSQPVGFDRSNPNARPAAFNFDGLMSAANAGQQARDAQSSQGQGLLSMLNAGNGASSSLNLNANTPQVAPPPAAPAGNFVNQSATLNGQNMSGLGGIAGLLGTGGYGTWKYGQEVPQPGTPQYLDYMNYFQNGGADPNNLYGRGTNNYGNGQQFGGMGGGPGAGGVGAAGGAGAGSAAGGPGW